MGLRGTTTRRSRACGPRVKRDEEGLLERSQGREQFALSPRDELPLGLGTNLNQGDLGKASVDERPDLLDVLLDVGAACELFCDLLLSHELGGTLEGVRIGQIGVYLPAQPKPSELLVCALYRHVAVGVIGHSDLPDASLPRSASGIEHLAQLALWLDGDHQVGL